MGKLFSKENLSRGAIQPGREKFFIECPASENIKDCFLILDDMPSKTTAHYKPKVEALKLIELQGGEAETKSSVRDVDIVSQASPNGVGGCQGYTGGCVRGVERSEVNADFVSRCGPCRIQSKIDCGRAGVALSRCQAGVQKALPKIPKLWISQPLKFGLIGSLFLLRAKGLDGFFRGCDLASLCCLDF